MKNLFFIIILASAQTCLAQKFYFGLFAGGNVSTQFLHSKYEISDGNFEEIQTTPLPGFEFGIFTKHQFSKRISLISTLDIAHLAYKEKNEFLAANNVGEPIWSADKVQKCNNYLHLSPILSFTFFDRLILGTGIQMNVLLESRTNLGKDAPIEFAETINRYYKTITFSLPLKIGFQFSNIEISMEARMGIDNRIKGDVSLIQEREGTFALKFSYFFLPTSE
jgi:hypothetical protein